MLGAIVAALTFLVSAVKYFADRRDLLRQRRFENYHKLIDELVQGRATQQAPRLDSQIAVAYELRYYKEYKEVTGRILRGLLVLWNGRPEATRLVEEIELTLADLDEM